MEGTTDADRHPAIPDNQPSPVTGTVIDIDLGYPTAVILIVEKDGRRYYETYELVSVDDGTGSGEEIHEA